MGVKARIFSKFSQNETDGTWETENAVWWTSERDGQVAWGIEPEIYTNAGNEVTHTWLIYWKFEKYYKFPFISSRYLILNNVD